MEGCYENLRDGGWESSLHKDWQIANAPSVHGQAAASASSSTTSAIAAPAATTSSQVCLLPPAPDRMKCNINAAFSTQRNIIEIGICLCDEGGVFVLAKNISFVSVYAVDIGEALGLHLALQWVSDLQLQKKKSYFLILVTFSFSIFMDKICWWKILQEPCWIKYILN